MGIVVLCKSDEDRECRTNRIGQHHGAVNLGSCAQVGKTIEPLLGTVADQSRWDHLTVARHLPEKTYSSMLVVTIREGAERGKCSASLVELLRIVKDQIEERGVVIIVSNRESAIWRDASVKTVLREIQLKYVDVEEMRVITSNRCVADKIKNDKAENVATGGIKIGS